MVCYHQYQGSLVALCSVHATSQVSVCSSYDLGHTETHSILYSLYKIKINWTQPVRPKSWLHLPLQIPVRPKYRPAGLWFIPIKPTYWLWNFEKKLFKIMLYLGAPGLGTPCRGSWGVRGLIHKNKLWNKDAATHMEVNAFGWTQRQQTTEPSHNARLSCGPHTPLISDWCIGSLKLK